MLDQFRFSDLSGKMNSDIFLQSYKFLDEHQEDEIKQLEKKQTKVRSDAKKQELKESLVQMKQQMTERRRDMKVRERLKEAKQQEKEKVMHYR